MENFQSLYDTHSKLQICIVHKAFIYVKEVIYENMY